jgi:enoyl-CoA hydratase/carnithine racemase
MDGITLSIDASLARLKLNRPQRRNAVSFAMWRALPRFCAEIEAAEEALAVIVEGAGDHFSAGADIGEFESVYGDASVVGDYLSAIQDGLNALIRLDRPTLAVVRGNAIGGGLAIALCCDLRFCAAGAHLAATPAKLGLLYGFAETRRLVEAVGPSRAKDILFSGRRVAVEEALAIGLIDRLVPREALDEAATAYALELARLSQFSIRGSKAAVEAVAGGLAKETPAFRRLIQRAAAERDWVEGAKAFAEKRSPCFASRRRVGPLG